MKVIVGNFGKCTEEITDKMTESFAKSEITTGISPEYESYRLVSSYQLCYRTHQFCCININLIPLKILKSGVIAQSMELDTKSILVINSRKCCCTCFTKQLESGISPMQYCTLGCSFTSAQCTLISGMWPVV